MNTRHVLLVLHKLSHTLGFYDVETGQQQFNLPTNEFPHEMTFSAEGQRLYVTETGVRDAESPADGGNTIAVFSVENKERVGTIDTGQYRKPCGIDIHYGATGRLFITSAAARTLLIYDLESASLLHAVDTQGELPRIVTVALDGATAFTANAGSSTLTAIDVEAGRAIKQIPMPERPEGMALSIDGTRLFVACREGNAIAVIDAEKLEMVDRIDTGRGPVRVVMSPDGRWIATSLIHSDAIQVADIDERKVIQTIPVGRQPSGMAISIDGTRLFASCEIENRVYVISTSDFQVIRQISTDNGPDAMECLEQIEMGGASQM